MLKTFTFLVSPRTQYPSRTRVEKIASLSTLKRLDMFSLRQRGRSLSSDHHDYVRVPSDDELEPPLLSRMEASPMPSLLSTTGAAFSSFKQFYR